MNLRLWILVFMLQPFVSALAARTEAITPVDVTQVKALDEIVVGGDRNSLSAARKAVVEAEDRFYARFNAINDDPAYDMRCSRRAPTGSLVERRVCLPRLVDDAIEANTQEMLRTTGGPVYVVPPETLYASAIPEQKRRMLALLKKDPELLRALLERARLQQHYDELHKRKFDGHWVVLD